MTPTQFHGFFARSDPIFLEKADADKNFDAIADWLNDGNDKASKQASNKVKENKVEFLKYHIKMTSPIFGKWNWTKREENKTR